LHLIAEASICFDAYYSVDLTANSNQKTICKSVALRYSYLKVDPNATLARMKSLRAQKQDSVNLALAYYKLGEYTNLLRIECFFSGMTVLIRDISGKDHVYTNDMKEHI